MVNNSTNINKMCLDCSNIQNFKGSVYNFQQIVVRIAANLILTTNDITESIE